MHNECGYFKTLWLANDKWGLKCILHNECGYFKTLWFANDKWGLKCILHNECGYFKTLWFANDEGSSVFCIMNVDISKHYDLQMINDG